METIKESMRPSKAKYDPVRTMKSLQYQGKVNTAVKESPVPLVTDSTDAIIKVSATTICGSDLHIYHNETGPFSKKGDILGHESVGIIDDVGLDVKNFKKGDRVVISAIMACGMCEYCKRGEWSCCDITNTSPAEEAIYGHRQGAAFGYSHLLGGWDGCQAEFVRVPFADVNLFHIPQNISDSQALMIADIACTGFHGCELADVKKGDKVVIFGCGPVGLMAQMWAKFRGAETVIGIDVEDYRLEFAQSHFANHTVNAKHVNPIDAVKLLIPGGPDKVIDCVGFRFPDSLLHKVERLLMLETDSPNIVNSAIKMVRKNGRITLIGDYFGFTNHFNIGGLMEKHLTMNGGQVWPQAYHNRIFEWISAGKVDPSVVITHAFPFSKCAEAYKIFDEHKDGIIKALLLPDELYEKNKPIIKKKVPNVE
jgi:threonine dehydrogenase-like Zn-dependent dehydrogenase